MPWQSEMSRVKPYPSGCTKALSLSGSGFMYLWGHSYGWMDFTLMSSGGPPTQTHYSHGGWNGDIKRCFGSDGLDLLSPSQWQNWCWLNIIKICKKAEQTERWQTEKKKKKKSSLFHVHLMSYKQLNHVLPVNISCLQRHRTSEPSPCKLTASTFPLGKPYGPYAWQQPTPLRNDTSASLFSRTLLNLYLLGHSEYHEPAI